MAKRKKKVENKRILALELYKGFLKAEPDLADQAKAAIEDFKTQGAKWDEKYEIAYPFKWYMQK